MTTRPWFEVDRAGLAKLLAERGVAFVLYELLANAWDAPGTTKVDVTLVRATGRARARLKVVDDAPDGFTRLEHSWTLFAESERKADSSKRGRWNLGEKLVLSLCEEATVVSTTGGVRFDDEGRHTVRRRTARGSEFEAIVRLTAEQVVEVLEAGTLVVPPPGVTVTINGAILPAPRPVRDPFKYTLPTEVADEDGLLRRRRLTTTVTLYAPGPQGARLCEMGIPVVPTDLPWTVDVAQKVPLTLDRVNVAPGFLRELRVAVLNHMAEKLPQEAVNASWVRDACGSAAAAPGAVRTVLERRYGPDAVAYDPSDPEGSKLSVADGRTVVAGGSLSAGEWANARKAGVLLPAGQVTPSPRVLMDPDGEPPVPESDWNPLWKRRAEEAKRLFHALFGYDIIVQCSRVGNARAWFGLGSLTLQVTALKKEWFEKPLLDEEVLSLLIHEFAHEVAMDHLSTEYHKACCDLGARCARLAFERPDLLGKGN